MSIEQILPRNGVHVGLKANCKREVLSALADAAAELTGEDRAAILDILLEREKLGTTGVGEGVAIPHGKIENLSRIVGVFVSLEKPVDFDAVDGEPVDLFFLLLAPSNATAAHLKALAKVARLLRDDQTRTSCREAESAEAMWAIATSERKSDAA